jgi:DNA polymerase
MTDMNTLDLRQHLAVAATSLRSCLEQHQAAGIQVLPAAVRATVDSVVADAVMAAGDDETGAAADLRQLREILGECRRCKLCQGRTNIVYGVGAPDADVMFVGEGPGRDEDLQGEPFVGRAGQLLTDIITKGMKLRREDVYIANVVKCRPPQNRDPEPEEVASCEPFLIRQIELVKPRVIIALGKFATQTLVRSAAPISRLRGQWHDYHGTRLMPTFHPAYLLRNPGDKGLVWEDIKSVLRELGTVVG